MSRIESDDTASNTEKRFFPPEFTILGTLQYEADTDTFLLEGIVLPLGETRTMRFHPADEIPTETIVGPWLSTLLVEDDRLVERQVIMSFASDGSASSAYTKVVVTTKIEGKNVSRSFKTNIPR